MRAHAPTQLHAESKAKWPEDNDPAAGTSGYFSALLTHAVQDPHGEFFNLTHAPGGRLTFMSMRDGIASAASYLRQAGVRADSIVLIFGQHSSGALFAFFAAQLLGAVPAFMTPPTSRQAYRPWLESHRALVQRIGPAVLVSETRFIGSVLELGHRPVISAGDIESAPSTGWPASWFSSPDRVAFLQFSSGTTGLKKGVAVTYAQLAAQIEAYSGALAFDARRDCVVSWLPPYHDMGLIAATLMPFVLAARARILDTFRWLTEPQSYIDELSSASSAVSWLPNFAFEFLAQRCTVPRSGSLASVKAVVNCSEPCKSRAMEAFIRRFSPAGLRPETLRVCYAMAENVFAVTQTLPSAIPRALAIDADVAELRSRAIQALPDARKAVFCSVGIPIPGVEIAIAGSCPGEENVIGEILLRGPSLCAGYFGNPEETAKRFRHGWYHSRDLGFLAGGELYVTGRIDDLIIIRGRNIYAHDVEEIVNNVGVTKPGRVVALGIHDEASGTQDLIVVGEAEASAGAAAQRAIREAVLNAFAISPAEICLVPLGTLVKTSSGKISRKENLKRYLDGSLTARGGTEEVV